MDPDAVLARFRAAMVELESATDPEMAGIHAIEAADAAESLFNWLATGGFAPDWSIV